MLSVGNRFTERVTPADLSTTIVNQVNNVSDRAKSGTFLSNGGNITNNVSNILGYAIAIRRI